MKTLIVEDDFTSRLVLQHWLSPYGECHVAVNGKEAVEAFRAARESGPGYDLICMDIMMPEMDGQAALREIRGLEAAAGPRATRAVKVVMTTCLDQPKNVMQAFRGSADGYLVKPLDNKKLLELIGSLELIEVNAPLPDTI